MVARNNNFHSISDVIRSQADPNQQARIDTNDTMAAHLADPSRREFGRMIQYSDIFMRKLYPLFLRRWAAVRNLVETDDGSYDADVTMIDDELEEVADEVAEELNFRFDPINAYFRWVDSYDGLIDE